MVDMETDLKRSTEVLMEGGVILYPTDTVWGIGCDATNDEAIKKIYALKQRAESKAMIILLPDENDLIHFTESPLQVMKEYLRHNDRPTTIIFPNAKNISSSLMAEDGSVAIRIVKDDFCIALIKKLGKPLVSTSANRSGAATPLTKSSATFHVPRKSGTPSASTSSSPSIGAGSSRS